MRERQTEKELSVLCHHTRRLTASLFQSIRRWNIGFEALLWTSKKQNGCSIPWNNLEQNKGTEVVTKFKFIEIAFFLKLIRKENVHHTRIENSAIMPWTVYCTMKRRKFLVKNLTLARGSLRFTLAEITYKSTHIQYSHSTSTLVFMPLSKYCLILASYAPCKGTYTPINQKEAHSANCQFG